MAKTKALSIEQMREVVRGFCKDAGSLQAAADLLSTDKSQLSLILSGERTVGDRLAAQLGFQKVKQSKTVSVVFYIGERQQ